MPHLQAMVPKGLGEGDSDRVEVVAGGGAIRHFEVRKLFISGRGIRLLEVDEHERAALGGEFRSSRSSLKSASGIRRFVVST
jgi:hypothetical protein